MIAQDASKLATTAFKTSRRVFQLLTKFNLRPSKGEAPLKVLEVGAINTQLHVWRFPIEVQMIDSMTDDC
jgi:25S rRNA (adenine2142-N1)-methyltransferase